MSDKQRHFQLRPDTAAIAAYTEMNAKHLANAGYTEVQVVPLDAIVIRRDELPKVTRSGPQRRVGSENMTVHEAYSWEMVRASALSSLALSEDLRAHPPVDAEQVARISKLIVAADHEDINYLDADDVAKIAYRLVERGVRVGDA